MGIPTTIKSQTLIVLFFLTLISGTLSCSKLISDEFPEFNEVPTVNSLIIAGEYIKVHVSLAEKIDSTYLTLINNAEVLLTSSQGEKDTLELVSNGLYRSDFIAQQGLAYTIEVQIDGFDRIVGSDSVPIPVAGKIFDHTNQYRYNEEGNFMEGIGIEFYDNPETDDYYELVLIKAEYDYAHAVSAYNDNSAIILNEGFEPYTTGSLVFSDQLMDDSNISLYLDFYQGAEVSDYGDSLVQTFNEHTIILELRHISEEYYYYKKHLSCSVKSPYSRAAR